MTSTYMDETKKMDVAHQHIPSLEQLARERLSTLLHPSLKSDALTMDLLGLKDLLSKNKVRNQAPNVVIGRVGPFISLSDPFTRLLNQKNTLDTSRLTPKEQRARLTGQPMAFATFEWVDLRIKVRLDSYVHPEFWIEFYLPSTEDGFYYLKIRGRTCSGPSQPFLTSVCNGRIRLDDKDNPSFWLEFNIPSTV